MTRRSLVPGSALASLALLAFVPLAAADQKIIGKRFAVTNRGAPEARKVTASAGKSDHFLQIFGDPDLGGSATLIVILEGANPNSQSFFLPQGTSASGSPFWRFVAQTGGGGYLYRDPNGEQGPVVKVLVKPGDTVAARQGVIVVEAMKMENELRAPRAGTVVEVHATEGTSVEAGASLIVIE